MRPVETLSDFLREIGDCRPAVRESLRPRCPHGVEYTWALDADDGHEVCGPWGCDVCFVAEGAR